MKRIRCKNKGEYTSSYSSPKQLVHTEHSTATLFFIAPYRIQSYAFLISYNISIIFNIQVKFLCFLPDVQTGAHVYIINGLEGPPNEREVNMYLVAHPPLTPKFLPQITKLHFKSVFT